jgi:hypothetical protein
MWIEYVENLVSWNTFNMIWGHHILIGSIVPFKPLDTTSCCLQSCHNYCPFSNMLTSLLVALHGACSTSNDLPPFLYHLQHPTFLHNQYLPATIVPFKLQTIMYWHFPSTLYHYDYVLAFSLYSLPLFPGCYLLVATNTLFLQRLSSGMPHYTLF